VLLPSSSILDSQSFRVRGGYARPRASVDAFPKPLEEFFSFVTPSPQENGKITTSAALVHDREAGRAIGTRVTVPGPSRIESGGNSESRARQLFVAAMLLGCACAAPWAERASLAGTLPKHSHADEMPAEVQDLFQRINRHRHAIGCHPLEWDRRLARLALRQSEDMAHRHYFDHVNPDGLDPFQRMDHAGLRYYAAAENLAMGAVTGREVYEGWMDSRGHRHNLENCMLTRIGLGRYGDYWSCEMAKLTPESTP
jgi:hypothetical protein